MEELEPDVWDRKNIEQIINSIYTAPSYVQELKTYELERLENFFKEELGMPIHDPMSILRDQYEKVFEYDEAGGVNEIEEKIPARSTGLTNTDILHINVASILTKEILRRNSKEDPITPNDPLIQSHRLAFLFKLGLLDFLKTKIKNQKPTDVQIAKLIAQMLMDREDLSEDDRETKISTIRTAIKDWRNKRKKLLTPKAKKTIEKLKVEHDLFDL